MSKVGLSHDEMQVTAEQMLAVLTGDDTEAVTMQMLQDCGQQFAAVRLMQEQQIKDDIKYITSELTDADTTGDSTTLSDLETSLKNRVDSLQSQTATNQKECQQLKEQLANLHREQQKLRDQRRSQKDAKTAALPVARCDANLYINITSLRWQYNCEPHEVKGYISNKQDVKTFNLNSQEVSRFFITNYLWDLVEEDW